MIVPAQINNLRCEACNTPLEPGTEFFTTPLAMFGPTSVISGHIRCRQCFVDDNPTRIRVSIEPTP